MTKDGLKLLVNFISFFNLSLGLLVMIGWFSHSERIVQILPSLVPMQFNTALGFILSGLLLAMLTRGYKKGALLLSSLLGLIALLTLLEYVFRIDLLIDQLFMKHYITTETSHPGRMAPNTALCFFISALAFILYISKDSLIKFVGALGGLTYILGVIALIGYVIDLDSGYLINIQSGYFTEFSIGYHWGKYTSMALHTSIGMIFLGMGIVLICWQNVLYRKLNFGLWNIKWLFIFAIPLLLTLLIIDLSLPHDISVGIGYILIIVLSILVESKRATLSLAIIATLFILLGYFLTQKDQLQWIVFLNRGLAILSIWVITISLINLIKKNKQFIEVARLLKRKNVDLNHKNKDLEQMTYMATHDLREPLQTVKNFIKLLEKELDEYETPNKALFLQYIDSSTERMDNLIKGILGYSRLGTNRQIELVNCHEIVQNVREDLDHLIKSTNTRFDYENLPLITGCKTELHSLFLNIISNSIKFKKHDQKPIIKIEVQESPREWAFFIVDNGIGIAADETERIFSLFQRLHLQEDYPGTGIGLAYCKKIVSLHGGKIHAESEAGVGTTIKFTIPINRKP